ncbi:Tm-1-like ATP-binding domain-containing protein [Amycolatopsis sp. FDAARGOS 1241]|uniref:Tm-1-like ATP-binding domain-containing protein n=1 Tax=Amycolatopsis sp. FDAARGOS 1241 TaxID=2778070 RepID=UPI001951AC1B|nr:Tm-1-like ATP-binding domain-containing protein [Amycolatopsis sp. FDAARGOS 1241]QRP48784.1 Tm-1-like ATP-binding domain-containing protein [Amycolatopsis sp. FDAARGOS 1241]
MATVCLVGTLDTKRAEYDWLRTRLEVDGVHTLLVDAGSSGSEGADVPAEEVARAAGAKLESLRGDRGRAVETMARGAAVVVRRLFDEGRVDGVLAVGGSGGSSIAAAVMRELPVGVPKLLVSTMASGDVRPYVGETDVTLMYSVVDIAGLNAVSTTVFGNAVAAIAAMARRRDEGVPVPERPVVAVTMFGVTTPAADEARAELAGLGYEVLVFHATGSGGRAMEKLVTDGLVAGVLDLTTTELADELVGGVLSAGPHRLEAAGRAGVPQVVSVGALDMVNFGPADTVPERFAERNLLVHNPTVTLMRTTPEETAQLGTLLGRKLRAARGPVSVLLPLGGVSAVDVPGGPFHDPAADAALFTGLTEELAGSAVSVQRREEAINDPGFGAAAARELHRLIGERKS